jgi:hypothetical protein
MVACLGVVLNGANLYGYVRCKMGSRQKLSTVATNFLGQQVLGSVSNKVYHIQFKKTTAYKLSVFNE